MRHLRPPHTVPRVRVGMVGADAAPVKGILKPSRAWAPAASDDASDEGARRRALVAGKAPERPPSRDEDTATTTYERFHDRVGAVFANLGPGLTTPGVSDAARPDPPAWMPANTSVFRRGRDVSDRDDEDDDSEPDPDDDALEPAYRDPSDGAGPSDEPQRWEDDLDCLRSDDDDEGGGDDDGKDAGRTRVSVGDEDAHLRRSVGRCVALNREDEYDAADAFAMTGGRVDITTVAAEGGVGGRLEAFANAPDDEEAALRPDSVVVERDSERDSDDDSDDRSAAKRSDGTRRARATLAPYVPPAKRAKRGVTWAPASAGVSGAPRPSPAPATRAPTRRRARGARAGNSWVPDHVKHPERYTCYTLDEPLIIGGGLSGNGSRAKARGVRGENEKVRGENARSPPFGERRYGVGVALDRPGERPRGGRETGTKTHSVSSVSDGGGGEAEAFGCGRRGGGDGDGARVFREGRRRGRRRGGRGRGRTRRGGGWGRTREGRERAGYREEVSKEGGVRG